MQRTWRGKISRADHTRPRRRLFAGFIAGAIGALTVLVAGPISPVPSVSAQAPEGQGFTLNKSDLQFILKQIKISENHSVSDRSTNLCNGLLGDAPDQIPDNGVGVTLPWGLRTVDGTCNNLLYDGEIDLDQTRFGAADQLFPRHVPAQFKTTPNYRANPQPAGSGRRRSPASADQQPDRRPDGKQPLGRGGRR